MNEKPEITPPEGPSKSQRKRDSSALQDIGEALTKLSAAGLAKCELPEILHLEIEEYARLPNKHGARKRQLQYIGKQMRDLPEETLQRIATQIHKNDSLEKRRFMELEELRARLLAGDSAATEALLKDYPDVDMQQLRQLIRQAQREQESDQPPLTSRKLFQFLRNLYGV